MKRAAVISAAALMIFGASGPALADLTSSKPMGFRTSGERLAQISAENLRIQAENLTFQQEIVMTAMQRGEIINNMIIINQSGNGSIVLDAHQLNEGTSTIGNDMNSSMYVPGGSAPSAPTP